MLKLNVSNEDKLDDIIITEDTELVLHLDNSKVDINIDVMDNMCLQVFDLSIDTSNHVNYNLRNNTTVIVNKISRDNSDIVNISMGDNAILKYYSSMMNYKNNEFDMKVNHVGKNSDSYVLNHGVNFTDSELKFLVDTVISKDAIDTKAMQDSKIIDIGGGKNFIKPNVIVDNDMIVANHASYIGKFKKDEVFYLMSRGINESDTELLLTRGFLLNKMELDEKRLFEYNKFIDDNFRR